MKLSVVTALAVLVAAALLLAGCGRSGSEGSSSTAPEGGAAQEGGAAAGESGAPKKATAPNAPAGSKVVACKVSAGGTMQLRATAIDCGTARTTMRHWASSGACGLGGSGSRSSCALGDFRCQAVKVDRGIAVSCARPGVDISFIAKG